MKHQQLKARQPNERAQQSASVTLRVHRALSWLERAERERFDADARFIFLWISFNAMYASEVHDPAMTEKRGFQNFLRTLLRLDSHGRIAHLVWTEFPGNIRLLLTNEYVFPDFWRHHNGQLTAAEWQSRFRKSRRAAELALAGNHTLQVLSIVSGRLYVLRNQLIHGGATWNSKVNRSQVRDCSNLLGKLVPVIIDIMQDHPKYNWGPATYPVIKQ